MEPEDSQPFLQKSAIRPYPDSGVSSSYLYTPTIHFSTARHLLLLFQLLSHFLPIFDQKCYIHLSFL